MAAMETRTIPPPARRLLVFARLPEEGAVKTRLAASIGTGRALDVYQAMLTDLLANIGMAGPPSDEDRDEEQTEIEILWAPTEAATGAALRRAFGGFSVAMQTGDDLGDRLSMAFSERFFFHQARKIIAIGVDDPTLSRALIDHAFGLLESCEWVVGPADDGGYYLIGCRAAAFSSKIFSGIEWSTDQVLPTTLARIREARQTVASLPSRFDIDREEDLRQLSALAPGGATGDLLRSWGWMQ
jgi:rSAM/selenodomain-associated transferase 1